MPSQQYLLDNFTYDPLTGHLYTKYKRGKLKPGSKFGSICGKGYVLCGLGNHHYELAHRIIWTMLHGPITDGMVIDHINGNPSDNRVQNLRLVTRALNQRNAKLFKTNTSGFTGVRYDKKYKRWVASITLDDRYHHLGYHNTFEEAVAARQKANNAHGFHPNHGRLMYT